MVFKSYILWPSFEAHQQETIFLVTSGNQEVAQGKARTICSPQWPQQRWNRLRAALREALEPPKEEQLHQPRPGQWGPLQPKVEGKISDRHFSQARGRREPLGQKRRAWRHLSFVLCSSPPWLLWEALTGHCKASVPGGKWQGPDTYFLRQKGNKHHKEVTASEKVMGSIPGF